MLRIAVLVIFLLSLFLTLSNTGYSQKAVQFQQIRLPELYQNIIFCIAQDSLGFLWFGTNNELIQRDGFQTVAYRHNSWGSNSLSGNSISGMLMGHENMVKVVTYGGVAEQADQRKKHYRLHRNDSFRANTLSDNIICLPEGVSGGDLFWRQVIK